MGGLHPATLLLYSAPRSASGDEWMRFLPMGLGCLQAMLKSRGFPCRLANLSGKGRREILAYLKAQRADVIGVSMFTFNRSRCFELLRLAREACPGALLLAGGPHPTHLAQEVFQECPSLDAIVRGEGESPLLAVVEALQTASGNDGWKNAPGLILRNGTDTGPSPVIEDLDAIGLVPEHFEADFADPAEQLSFLGTSRGCPATCAFCNTPEFWGNRIRLRSSALVMAEMRMLRERWGLTYFSFRDDTFTTKRTRILELMELIRDSGLHPLWNCQSRVNLVDEERLVAMKRAGCEFMQFGVEHGSERILTLLNKGTNLAQARKALGLVRKVGLNLGIYLITGIPGETGEDVEETVRLMRDVKPHDVQISPLAIYPGTRLFERYRAEGRISVDFFHSKGDAEVFARVDAHTETSLHRLHQVAEGLRERARYTPMEFVEQKRFLGFCAVTNLLCGEAAEERGLLVEAEAEYAEIILREPRNPWGFLKRALLLRRAGKTRRALEDLREVLTLAPGNPEAAGLMEAWRGRRTSI